MHVNPKQHIKLFKYDYANKQEASAAVANVLDIYNIDKLIERKPRRALSHLNRAIACDRMRFTRGPSKYAHQKRRELHDKMKGAEPGSMSELAMVPDVQFDIVYRGCKKFLKAGRTKIFRSRIRSTDDETLGVEASLPIDCGKIVALDHALYSTLHSDAEGLRCTRCHKEYGFDPVYCQCEFLCLTAFCSPKCVQLNRDELNEYECCIDRFLQMQPQCKTVVRMVFETLRNEKCLRKVSKTMDELRKSPQKRAANNVFAYDGLTDRGERDDQSIVQDKLPSMHMVKQLISMYIPPNSFTINEQFRMHIIATYIYKVIKHSMFIKESRTGPNRNGRLSLINILCASKDQRKHLRSIILAYVQVVRVHGRFQHIYSSIRMPNETYQPRRQAFGLFPMWAALRHSVTPNAIALSLRPKVLALCTLRPLRRGEELTIDKRLGSTWQRHLLAPMSIVLRYRSIDSRNCKCIMCDMNHPFAILMRDSKFLPYGPFVSTIFARHTTTIRSALDQIRGMIRQHDEYQQAPHWALRQLQVTMCMYMERLAFGPRMTDDWVHDEFTKRRQWQGLRVEGPPRAVLNFDRVSNASD